MSRIVGLALAGLGLLLTAQMASGASWSIGSHISIATIRSGTPGSGSSTVVAWPSNAFTYQPALRIALSDKAHTHELLVDSGLFLLDQAGSTLSLFTGTASYQHTFSSAARIAAFANLGAGIFREGGAARGTAKATFGGGAGVRRIVGDGKGIVRAELRGDHLQSDGAFGRPALTSIGLRLGFDLWL